MDSIVGPDINKIVSVAALLMVGTLVLWLSKSTVGNLHCHFVKLMVGTKSSKLLEQIGVKLCQHFPQGGNAQS